MIQKENFDKKIILRRQFIFNNRTVSQLRSDVFHYHLRKKEDGPKKVKDIELLNGEQILSDKTKINECYRYPEGICIIQVAVRSPPKQKQGGSPKNNRCLYCCRTPRK